MQNLKRNDTNELIYKTETDSQRMNLGLLGWHGVKRWFRGVGTDMCTLLYLRWITSNNLLDSIGNSAQCYMAG